jgi:phosphatidylethanolamine-binding protein (PEBP) family uncharacterized protein
VAALALTSCGGSSQEGSTGSASTGKSAPAAHPGGAASGAGGASAKAHSTKAQADKAASAAGADASAQAGQKHGSPVAKPKGPPEQAPTPEQVAEATVADMSLESPTILSTGTGPGTLPATYTCDGKGSWPALRWAGVPAGTAELVLFAMNLQPVGGKLFVDWAVAGLEPSLEGIEAGKLPQGAILGTNGFGKRGYEICPSGSGEIYMFAVYALPRRLSPPKGFDARELRKEVLGVSGNVGLLPALYTRS